MKHLYKKMALTGLILLLSLPLMAFTNAPPEAAAGIYQSDEPGEEPADENGKDTSAYCKEDSEKQHPVAESIAERYGSTYEEVMLWFCDGYGMGEIMLAFQTAMITGDDPAALLDQKGQGVGWGLIWQEMGLIGKKDDANPPVVRGCSDHAKNPGEPCQPSHTGKPDETGPPDHANNKDNKDNPGNGGKPDETGPPDHANNDKGKPEDKGKPDK